MKSRNCRCSRFSKRMRESSTTLTIKVKEPGPPIFVNGICGGLAGTFADAALHPLDTLKTRYVHRSNTRLVSCPFLIPLF